MRHFFTRDTVEASIWCTKCGRDTPWVVMGGRPGYCKVCQAKPLAPVKHELDRPTSGDLFE